MRQTRRALALVCVLALSAPSTGAADFARFLAPAGSRVALRPPPAGPAPAREPAARSAPSAAAWSRSAAAVGAYLQEAALALWASHRSPAPLAPAAAAEPAVFETVAAPLPAAAPQRFADRIFIAGGAGVIGAYGELDASVLPDTRPSPYAPRFTGFWTRGDGVSARVDYLDPWGLNEADATGFTLRFRGRAPRRVESREPVPPVLRRAHPVYFAGDEVTVELLLRNDTGRALEDVRVTAGQEGLMLDGSAGPPLDAGHAAAPLRLEPGQTKTVRWTIRMGRRGSAPVNFEQTALRVEGAGEDGRRTTLLDAHQAGIVDPPAP